MLLFDSQVSGNCYKVRLLLAHLGMTYDRHEVDVVDRSNRAGLLGALNPALRVPTLVLDDDRVLAESNAILWYLAQGTQYLPEEAFERAKALQWMFFEQYSHEPNIAVALDAMERHLAGREFLVGERYSAADIALYAYTHVADEGGFDLARYPAIGDWIDRVAGQPGHVPITA